MRDIKRTLYQYTLFCSCENKSSRKSMQIEFIINLYTLRKPPTAFLSRCQDLPDNRNPTLILRSRLLR